LIQVQERSRMKAHEIHLMAICIGFQYKQASFASKFYFEGLIRKGMRFSSAHFHQVLY